MFSVEGDSKLIIDCVNGICITPWRLKTVICDILHLRNSFKQISFTHVLREENFTTDTLANLGHSIVGSRSWEDNFSLNVLPTFNFDQCGVGYPQGFSL